ncbi:hypothetical protein KJ059_17145 [Myxococcota bacterium]|nr:hypothetical protein [Myxococcota bacterium]MCZ7619887.1 hypothetical protein [Myxococcota bacterium]
MFVASSTLTSVRKVTQPVNIRGDDTLDRGLVDAWSAAPECSSDEVPPVTLLNVKLLGHAGHPSHRRHRGVVDRSGDGDSDCPERVVDHLAQIAGPCVGLSVHFLGPSRFLMSHDQTRFGAVATSSGLW